MKIGSPLGGASDTESDVRALRQQFGVPKRLPRHTGVRALAAPSKADVGPRRRPPPYFHPFGVALQEGPWVTGVKIALAAAHFHSVGVALAGP